MKTRAARLGRATLGYASYLDGNLEEAWAEITQCLTGLRRIGAVGDMNFPLPIASIVAVAMGRPEVGVRLGAAFEGLSSSMGFRRQASLFYTDLQEALAEARTLLGDAVYASAWERGLAMDADDAMDLVRQPN